MLPLIRRGRIRVYDSCSTCRWGSLGLVCNPFTLASSDVSILNSPICMLNLGLDRPSSGFQCGPIYTLSWAEYVSSPLIEDGSKYVGHNRNLSVFDPPKISGGASRICPPATAVKTHWPAGCDQRKVTWMIHLGWTCSSHRRASNNVDKFFATMVNIITQSTAHHARYRAMDGCR